jgi:hypothetical protein
LFGGASEVAGEGVGMLSFNPFDNSGGLIPNLGGLTLLGAV